MDAHLATVNRGVNYGASITGYAGVDPTISVLTSCTLARTYNAEEIKAHCFLVRVVYGTDTEG